MDDQVIYQSASQLARAIRRKEVSSVEVVEAHLKRIDEVNPDLNAVVQVLTDKALVQARNADAALANGEALGPIHGVPFTIKDNIESAGDICTGGTRGRASYVADRDATVVARMRAAGGILMGRTNVPELALALETDNLVYGRTSNPYDLSRTPGGSSGGEAAIIASGGSPLGLGSDIGGSVRLPAHFCGIAGIKPTSCRVPRTGHYPRLNGALDSMFQLGPMSRHVEDLILTLPLIAGGDWRDPAIAPVPLGNASEVDLKSLRVSFHTDNEIMPADKDTTDVIRAAAKSLGDAGLSVDEVRPTGIERTYEVAHSIWGADGGVGIEALLEEAGTIEPHAVIGGMDGGMEALRHQHGRLCSCPGGIRQLPE